MIKTMMCHKCGKETEIVLSEAGPHIKASCINGHYIKFLPQSELTGENEMSEYEITIELPGSQYNEVIIIEKYGDQYGLCLGARGKAGSTVFKKWCYPQFKKEPAERAVPWKLPLGNRADAVKVVTKIAQAFGVIVSGNKDDDIPY
jgi:hypothetical protein